MNIIELIKTLRDSSYVAKIQKINQLKAKLRDTDYKAIKFAEGEMSAEEYEPVKLERRAWREEINLLEAEIEEIKKNANK
jgi:hydrogenase maturation factor HypE